MSNQIIKNPLMELAEAFVKPENQGILKIVASFFLLVSGGLVTTVYYLDRKLKKLRAGKKDEKIDDLSNKPLIGDDNDTKQNQNEQDEERLKALIQLDRVERKIQNLYDRTEEMSKEVDKRMNHSKQMKKDLHQIALDQAENFNGAKKNEYRVKKMEIFNEFSHKKDDVSKKTSELREKISEIRDQISKIRDEISLITEQQTSRAMNRFNNICSIGFGFEDIQKENLETRKEEINQRILEINSKLEKLPKLESDQFNQSKSLNKLINMTNNEIHKDEIEKRTKLENEKSELEKEKSEIEKGLLLIQEESLKKLAKQKENQENKEEIEKLEAQKKEKENQIEEKQKEIKEIEKEIESLKIEEEKEIERLNKEEEKILEDLKRDFENNTGVFKFYNRPDLSKNKDFERKIEKSGELNKKEDENHLENLNDDENKTFELNQNSDQIDVKGPNENGSNTNISSQIPINESNPGQTRSRRNSEIIVGGIDEGLIMKK